MASRDALVAERIREARRLAGMTQGQVAGALGVVERTYSRWEANETSGAARYLPRLAKLFNTPEAWLRADDQTELLSSTDERLDRLEDKLDRLDRLEAKVDRLLAHLGATDAGQLAAEGRRG